LAGIVQDPYPIYHRCYSLLSDMFYKESISVSLPEAGIREQTQIQAIYSFLA
jgi:hypothetical protein